MIGGEIGTFLKYIYNKYLQTTDREHKTILCESFGSYINKIQDGAYIYEYSDLLSSNLPNDYELFAWVILYFTEFLF